MEEKNIDRMSDLEITKYLRDRVYRFISNNSLESISALNDEGYYDDDEADESSSRVYAYYDAINLIDKLIEKLDRD